MSSTPLPPTVRAHPDPTTIHPLPQPHDGDTVHPMTDQPWPNATPPCVVWVVTVRGRLSMALATSEGAGTHRDFLIETAREDPACVEVEDWLVLS